MAEPPTLLTELLRSGRYDEFVRETATRGLLRGERPDLSAFVAELHAQLRSQRHPPGPTVEAMVIEQLVAEQILDAKARPALD